MADHDEAVRRRQALETAASPAVAALLARAHDRLHGSHEVPSIDEGAGEASQRIRAAEAPMVLAGPGVVRDGAVEGLRALAEAGNLGVLNTWGAKGLFPWQNRHHLATAGLQALDFELGGLTDADLVIATGLDPLEAPADRWEHLAPSIALAPAALASVAAELAPRDGPIPVPRLRTLLAAATEAGWANDGAPIAPSRATLNYARAIGEGGFLAADPGAAGFWVARTYGTSEVGSVVVPAGHEDPGFAAACVLVARAHQPARPALAVMEGAISAAVEEIVELGRSIGVIVPIEVWDPEAVPIDPLGHEQRVVELAHGDQQQTVSLATDPSQLERFIDAAGPVIAWT